MHVIVWGFDVKQGCHREFVKIYGRGGEWVQLFRRHAGYLGTELLRDANRGGRYLTIDRWKSREAYDAFKKRSREEYEALNARGEALANSERLVGRFDTEA
jgi:heme-degrading monooxygenase HmoA